jgi:hypothetical protein
MTRLRSLKKLKSEIGAPDQFSYRTVTYVLSAVSGAAYCFSNDLKFRLEFL